MKIAITGHTAGIGRSLANSYNSRGHEIIGLSKRHGDNIRNIIKISQKIEPCDMWINNAQDGFAQTELLFEMARRWQGTHKHIMVISTMMTQQPSSSLPGLDMDLYRVQKVALEESICQIRNRHLKINLTLVRPGNVATSTDKTVPPAANVDHWAETLVKLFETAAPDLVIPEISLAPRPI
jgi:NADP-dependent 3-hydroxy acid dehydrogenase YdfG